MGLLDTFSDDNEQQAANVEQRAYTRGYRGARRQLGRTLKDYRPYGASGPAAAGLYADALGLGGEGGTDRAVAAFRESPGYAHRLDEGLQAIARTRASRGELGGGQTGMDFIRYAGDLADDEYGGWMDRLSGERDVGLDVADRRAGVRGRIGDLFYATQLGRAGVKGNYLRGKDQTGANIGGLVGGGISLGAQLLGL